MTALELGLYALLLAAAAVPVWRRPVVALYLFVVGLALHNAAMAGLYAAGVRGSTLTAITAWKEILLAVALARVIRDAARERRLPFRPALVDWLALAFGLLAVAYALVPQSALGGLAGHRAVALGLRHDVVPVGAFFLGRSLTLGRDDLRRLAWTLLGTAGFVAVLGLVDAYAVPIGWWRTNGVVDYFHRHLGYDYHGTGERLEPSGRTYGLPENFIYNVGGDKPFLRRLVSTFLSPLASGYLMVVALLLAPRRRLAIPLVALAAAGLLWTFSRSSLVALAVGLVVLAVLRRRPPRRRLRRRPEKALPALPALPPRRRLRRRPEKALPALPALPLELVAAAVVVAVAIGWAHLFPKIGPTGNWTRADLTYQHAQAKGTAGTFSATSSSEPSLHEHWASLKQGVRTMVDHPQGYGLGNAGQTASRTGTPLKAGESNYTELGVELGVLGAVLWTLWGLALLVGLVRARAAALAAAFAAILVLAIQTDVIGDPWVAYCVWGLAGAMLLKTRPQERLAESAAPAVLLP